MHKASTDRRTSNNHHRALKCIVLLALVKVGSALKLTPVHHPSRKLLLDQESKSITLAFNEAKELISSETNPSSESSISHLIQNRVIKRLHTSIERWSLIEDRLRSAVSTSDQVKLRHADITEMLSNKLPHAPPIDADQHVRRDSEHHRCQQSTARSAILAIT